MDLPKIIDVLFNGRRAEEPKPVNPVPIDEIVRRGTSVVRVGTKLYKITAVEIDPSKL